MHDDDDDYKSTVNEEDDLLQWTISYFQKVSYNAPRIKSKSYLHKIALRNKLHTVSI